MSVYLSPRNKALGEFRIGSWSWGYLLEMSGPVIPGFWNGAARWYMVTGINRSLDRGSIFPGKDSNYPSILGDSGRSCYVTAFQARALANVARNWATIQQVLPETNRHTGFGNDQPWPQKVRDDWPPLFLAFADWAEKSRGFTK